MADWSRHHIWQIGLGVLVLAGAVVATIVLRFSPSEENVGMPEAQRAFWNWVGTISQDKEDAVASGIDLLVRHPELRLLYTHLAEVCRNANTVDLCRDTLTRVEPPDALTALYREAALADLLPPDDTTGLVQQWQHIAQSPVLDPALARRIVDLAFETGQDTWFADVENLWRWRLAQSPALDSSLAQRIIDLGFEAEEQDTGLENAENAWHRRLAEDETAVGAAFGEGYAAVLRDQLTFAESLLVYITQVLPDDPQAYRELGRVYLLTGDAEKSKKAAEAAIAAAVAQQDLEQELVMRGNLGWYLFTRDDDVKQSEELITAALKQSRLLGKETTTTYSYYRLATIYIRQSRYDEAFPLLDSAEVRSMRYVPKLYPHVILRRAMALSGLYRLSEAEATLEKAIAVADEEEVTFKLQALRVLSELRFQMGRYAAAREAALKMLVLAQNSGRTPSEIISRDILGNVERHSGNLEAAVRNFEQGAKLAEVSKDQLNFREITYELGLTTLDLQDANAAKEHFEALLASIQEDGNPIRLARAYLGLGRTYQQFQNMIEAVRYYDLALSQLVGSDDMSLHSEVLIAKASVLISTGAFDEAVALLHEAQQAEPNNQALIYEVEVGLGDVYLSKEQYAEALAHFEKAETIEHELPRPSMRWYVLFEKAQAYWYLHDNKKAKRAFEDAIKIIETLRENLNSSTNRSYFVQDKVRVYEHFATFEEEQGHIDEALYYTERARSRTLVDLLFTTHQEQKVDDTKATDRMIEVHRRMRALSQEISMDPFAANDDENTYSTTRTVQLRREYERADSLYQELRFSLTEEKPLYTTFNPLPPDSVRAMLEPGEAMVMYDLRTLGPRVHEKEIAVAFVILPDSIVMRKLDVRASSLTETVRFFRDQIGGAEGPGKNWEPASHRLYRDLIEPVLSALPPSVTHLHIVPEGVLHYLPFAALQDENGHFLVERYSLSVAPSASILKLSRDHNPRQWHSMLLFGDPDGRLPGSRKEVLAIEAAGSRRTALVGDEATQANLEVAAGEYDILHFATHGRFVARAPWRSHLELHGDDVLSIEEIGHLELNAYLVTLSACESALGGGLLSDVPNGDEWVGLNQAFLAAGTPTVMATLWPIDDLVSSQFMIDFYDALSLAGKAKALAEVQRQFIQNSDTRHPFYWAPFIVIGDPL